jgi:hypothetical protein
MLWKCSLGRSTARFGLLSSFAILAVALSFVATITPAHAQASPQSNQRRILRQETHRSPGPQAWCDAILKAHPEIRNDKAAMAQGCNVVVTSIVYTDAAQPQRTGPGPDSVDGGGGCTPFYFDNMWTGNRSWGPLNAWYAEDQVRWAGDGCSEPQVLFQNPLYNIWTAPTISLATSQYENYSNGSYRTAEDDYVFCSPYGCGSYHFWTDMPWSMNWNYIVFRKSWS